MTTQNYDLAMLAVMAIAILYGAWKGLAWQIASLAAIFASYFMAYHFRYTFAAWIPLKSPADVLLAMLFLYILGSAGIWVIFQWTARYIDRLRLRRFDRLLGALIGGIKGAIFCAVITISAVTLLGEKQRETIVHSGSGFSVAVMLENVQALLPEEIREAIAPYWRVLDQRLEQGHFEQGGGPRQARFQTLR